MCWSRAPEVPRDREELEQEEDPCCRVSPGLAGLSLAQSCALEPAWCRVELSPNVSHTPSWCLELPWELRIPAFREL